MPRSALRSNAAGAGAVLGNQTAWRFRRQAYTAMPNHTTFRPTDGHAPFQPLLTINPTAPRIFIHW